jgi:hypothetical protein
MNIQKIITKLFQMLKMEWSAKCIICSLADVSKTFTKNDELPDMYMILI